MRTLSALLIMRWQLLRVVRFQEAEKEVSKTLRTSMVVDVWLCFYTPHLISQMDLSR